MNVDFYKIPTNVNLQQRIEFYGLKREIGEPVEQWLKRVRSSIVSCGFPTIIHQFLLIDRFICELNKAEMKIIHSAGTWSTLKQLVTLLADQRDGPSENWNNSVAVMELAKSNDDSLITNATDGLYLGLGMKPFEFDGGYLSSLVDTCTRQAVDEKADNDMQIDGMGCDFDYYGYATNSAADEIDDNGCYAELPLEVVLGGSDQPKGPSNAPSSDHQGISFDCDICKKSFNHLDSLNAHKISIHHGTTYDCSICKSSFDHLSKLVQHKNTVHLKATYPCELCGRLFRKFSTLIAHTVRSHQEIEHECGISSEKLKTATQLKDHTDKHEGREFICDICGKSFTLKSSLKRHKNTVNCHKWCR